MTALRDRQGAPPRGRDARVGLAKARARRREREGGAVIFVVAMTLAVLAALGAYALNSASIEIKTAGYERQNTQTHYLSEYGVLAAMQDISPDRGQVYLDLMTTNPDASCTSLPGASFVVPNKLSRACRRMGSVEIARGLATTPPVALVPFDKSAPTVPGSLGLIPVDGDFYVELTEPTVAPPPPGMGTQLGGMCFVQMTVTSIGRTLPQIDNASAHTTALFAGAGVETARARVVGGPWNFSGCGAK